MQRIAPPDVWDSRPVGFAQAVASRRGTLVHVSGQVAWDLERRIVGEGDLGVQTAESLRCLERVVAAAGGTLDDIVALRLFIVEEVGADLAPVGEALRAAFEDHELPASTWVLVRGLVDPGMLIEIEATAVIDADAD